MKEKLIELVEKQYLRTDIPQFVTAGIGVERIIPVNSPNIDRIEVLKVGRVRRSKLYYLRGLSAKKARIKEIVK